MSFRPTGPLLIGIAGLVIACSDTAPGGDVDASGSADARSTTDALVEPGSEYVFDDNVLRTYELEIDELDWQWLNDNARLEEYVPATLIFEGRRIGPIGVRYKGGFGTLYSCFDDQGNRTCPKLSMKLKFNEYDNALRFHELKKLNFHSMKADPTALHDRLAYGLYRDMGVKAPRAVHARLIVNGELLGLFALIEQIDGRFSRMNFLDGGEGNVYKEVWPLYPNAKPYLNALRTNEEQNPDVSRMIAFATALANATDATIESVLEQWTDLDALMAYLAVDRAIENWDGIVGWWCIGGGCGNHNFYWYEETGRDKIWLIPWDMDNTFHVPNPFIATYGQPPWDEITATCDPVPIFDIDGMQVGRRPATCDPLIRWLATTLRPRYLTAVETLLDGPFQASAINAKLDRWESQIADAVAEDDNGPAVADWRWTVQRLRDNIASLRSATETVVGR